MKQNNVKKNIESKIWVFIEQQDDRLIESGLEILGRAMELTTGRHKIGALIAGHDIEHLSAAVSAYGADEVIVMNEPLLKEYCNTAYVKILENAVREYEPEILMMAATSTGIDIAARLAARLRTGLSAHCIDFEITDDLNLSGIIPWIQGGTLSRITCPNSRPQMITAIPGIFPLPSEASKRGKIITIQSNITEEDITYRVLEYRQDETTATGLETAETVIAGGWGIGSNEGWKLIEELAEVMNGSVGATRPAIDEKWAEESQMIGTSGRDVKPKLYMGIALSGHSHHLVGIKGAELRIGINEDQEAAIFENCDVGLVGDYQEIVPALIAALKDVSS